MKIKRMATAVLRAWLEIVSPFVVVAVTVASIPLVGGCSSDATKTLQAPADLKSLQQSATKVTGAEKLTKTLESLNSLCSNASKRLAKGKSLTADLAEFAGIREDLKRIDKMVLAEFAKTRKVLAKIKLPAKNKIQARVERDYAAKMRTTKRLVSAIAGAKGIGMLSAKKRSKLAGGLSRLSRFIDWVTPEEPHQPLGTELPHRIVDYDAGPPTLGTNIAPAYAPNTPGATPSPLPRTPTAADTSETIEVQFTEDISRTANQLQKNPVKMYEFVRNTMNFEPYYGSRKGANETLLEKGGNDFDQASLLIALFRYSGIPARYVQGVVDVPIAKAMNWVGVEKPEVAKKMFSAAGVPSQAIVSGGRITKLRIEHVWTEVYLDYQNYRGVPTGSSSGKKRWVPLDPGFKQYVVVRPMGLPDAMTEATGVVPQVADAVSIDPTTAVVSGIGTDLIEAWLGDVGEEASAYASSNRELEPSVLLGARRILQRRVGALPVALPLKAAAVASERAAVAEDCMHKVRLEMAGVVVEKPLAELAGKRVTIGYALDDEQDRSLGAEYSRLSRMPAYLLRATPVVLLDGRPAGTGNLLAVGTYQVLTLTYYPAKGQPSTVKNTLLVGGYYAVGIDLRNGSVKGLRRHGRVLESASDSWEQARVDSQARINIDDWIGEQLYIPLLGYFQELNSATRACADVAGVSSCSLMSIAMTGVGADVSRVYDVPQAVELSGLFMDVDIDYSAAFARNGNRAAESAYKIASGLVSSCLESAVWEQIFPGAPSSVSTVKVLQAAVEASIPLHYITPANAQTAVQQLQVGTDLKEDIIAATGAGSWVLIPQGPVTCENWTGTAYLVHDPDSGASGFMLSRGTGGSITDVYAGAAGIDIAYADEDTSTGEPPGEPHSDSPWPNLGVALDTLLGMSMVVLAATLTHLAVYGGATAATLAQIALGFASLLVIVPIVVMACFTYATFVQFIVHSGLGLSEQTFWILQASAALTAYLVSSITAILGSMALAKTHPGAVMATWLTSWTVGFAFTMTYGYMLPDMIYWYVGLVGPAEEQ